MSTTTGLIYGWGPDPNETSLDAFYFTANDWQTGDEVFRIYGGNGIQFNPVLGLEWIRLIREIRYRQCFESQHGTASVFTDHPARIGSCAVRIGNRGSAWCR